MITFELDTSDLKATLARVEREIDATPVNVEEIAAEAASHLRETDWYQDRTGDLRESTQARREGNEITLEMGMFYASFVQAAGYSDFDDVAEQTKALVVAGVSAALARAAR